MKKKLSKRKAGKRLNEEGRESPLEVFQLRQEYYAKLARDEIKLGDLGSREKIGEYLKLAQEAAEALAPYRHPRLQATAIEAKITPSVVRAPPLASSTHKWAEQYIPEHLKQEAMTTITIDAATEPTTLSSPRYPGNVICPLRLPH